MNDHAISFETFKNNINLLKRKFKFEDAKNNLVSSEKDYPDQEVWIKQQTALCTYKDEQIHPVIRFDRALEILEEIGLKNDSQVKGDADDVAETYALGGAVCKKKWEQNGQVKHLYESLAFYEKAHKMNSQRDPGYGAINAAYVLQILASRSRAASAKSKSHLTSFEDLEKRADILRTHTIELLLKRFSQEPELEKIYWHVVTIAEAFFGLKQYEEAKKWLEQAARIAGVSEWERQTSFQQFVLIAKFQKIDLPDLEGEVENWQDVWKSLYVFLGQETPAALSCYRGKSGIALSGGGFRASLYHIGVLARLAEMDALRSVEVISTVSGGSILGAYYYLEVKKLLESKTDNEITPQDYIDIVKRIEKKFISGIQENIRLKALSGFNINSKILIDSSYTRSNRLGELYEELLYSKIEDDHKADTPRRMKDLFIIPKGTAQKTFKPKFQNWKRKAKVPVLLLNATSLNTGHNWHFTAKSMGEPPGLVGYEIDKNARYKRYDYDHIPDDKLKNYRLGYAVAASACVPGLFEPLIIRNLEDENIIKLVDGGVHDNQGVQGLLDEWCSLIFCSDASGQMKDEIEPSTSILSLMGRSNSILMGRVRECEYHDLMARVNSQALRGLFFVHLKKNFPKKKVDWINTNKQNTQRSAAPNLLPYGVQFQYQNAMASLRTDLDAFSDVEACALMSSGYLMTKKHFSELQEQHKKEGWPGTWGNYKMKPTPENWNFLNPMKDLLRNQPDSSAVQSDLNFQLSTGSKQFLKLLILTKGVMGKLKIVVIMAAALICLISLIFWCGFFSILKGIGILCIAYPIFTVPMIREKGFDKYIVNFLILVFGTIPSKIYLKFFNGKFLKRGSVERLRNLMK